MKFFNKITAYHVLEILSIIGSSAATISGRAPNSCVANTRMPRGAWDSHLHILDPERFPPLPDADYKVGEYTVWDNAIFEHSISCSHVVMIQPSVYGYNNTLLLTTLKAYGPDRARGIVVFDLANTTAKQLAHWDTLGVRGVRLNYASDDDTPPPAELRRIAREYARVIKPLGWVLQFYVPMDVIPVLEPIVTDLGVRVVFDHFGNPTLPESKTHKDKVDPYELDGFPALVRLLKQGSTYVKISGAYRFSNNPGPKYKDVDPLAKELFRVAPERVVYASDWPHTRYDGLNIRPWNEHLLDLTKGNEMLRNNLFRDNAKRLWSDENLD